MKEHLLKNRKARLGKKMRPSAGQVARLKALSVL